MINVRTGRLSAQSHIGDDPMRSPPFLKWLCSAFVGAALTAGLASPALAEEPIALPRLDPAPAGDRMFGVPSPETAGHLAFHGMLLVDYAHNPLVIRRGNEAVATVVGSQLLMNLGATLDL